MNHHQSQNKMPAHDVKSGQKVAEEDSVGEPPAVPPAGLIEGKMSDSKHIPLETLYAIDCIDISKDGTHELVKDVESLAKMKCPTEFNRRTVFSENDYASLIKNAPDGKLRILYVRKKEAEAFHHLRELDGSEFFNHFSQFDIEPKKENYSSVWQPQEIGQFQHFLRYQADVGATRFYECYDYYKERFLLAAFELTFELKCPALAFAWKTPDKFPDQLVAVILSSHTKLLGPEANYTNESEPNSLTQWLFTNRHVSATRYNNDTLPHLGRLFLIDFLLFLTERWMPWIRWFEKTRSKINTEEMAAAMLLPNPDSILIGQISSLKPIITSIIDRIALLLKMLNLPTEVPCMANGTSDLNLKAEELMMRSKFLAETLQKIEVWQSKKFEDNLVRSNREEARALKRLTILASIFLPLSLSVGILSMNNRLVQIHLILWDFAGLAANLGAVTILFLWISKILDRWGTDHGAGLNCLQSETRKIFGTFAVFVAVVAFNIGIFWKIQVGWKILAGGLACIFVVSVVLIAAALRIERMTIAQELLDGLEEDADTSVLRIIMDALEKTSDDPTLQSYFRYVNKQIEKERQQNQHSGT